MIFSFLRSIRDFLFPIHAHEWKKFLPMFLILFVLCFNHAILRNLKDTLVVTASSSGAEIIPFIKVWAMLPTAIFLTFFFTRLSSRYSQEQVFFILLGGFLCFFLLFTYVFYPFRDTIHPIQWATQWENSVPQGLRGLLAMGRYWSFTLFYVMAESWGNIVLSILFWGFANEITSIAESRRFYGLLTVGSNLAGACAGQVANGFTRGQLWDSAFTIQMNIVVLGGLLILVLFRWMNKNVLQDASFDTVHKQALPKTRAKISLRESLRCLTASPYLRYIAVLVLAYNLSINLIEVVWKAQLRELYPDSVQFNTYMNDITTIFCVTSTIAAFFVPRLVNRFGWTKTALLAPLILLVMSIAFFSFFFFHEQLEWLTSSLFGTTALALSVLLGSILVVLSKAAKYSIFDTTKEMVFIPLDHESKLRGKAVIDGVGSRLGKSGGSLVHQSLLVAFGTVGASAPIVAVIVLGVSSSWLWATGALGREYSKRVGEVEEPTPSTSPIPAQ